MRKLLVLNNYDFSIVYSEVLKGQKPSHHLYGIKELQKNGWEVIIPNVSYPWLRKLSVWLSKIPFFNFGLLDQQWAAIRYARKIDLVYAPCQNVTVLLGTLAYFGIFRKPIIAIAHHPILRGRLASLRRFSLYFSINGHFCFGALSTVVANQIKSIRLDKRSPVFFWGPELRFYHIVQKPSVDFVVAGRTGRDYPLLADVIVSADVSGQVICSKLDYNKFFSHITKSSVEFIIGDSPEFMNYSDLVLHYSKSRLILIPMLQQDSLCGLTSLADAIACGIPVVINENKYLEIDAEKEGIGFVVKTGDVRGMQKAIENLLSNKEMYAGAKARLHMLGKNKYNIDHFVQQLEEVFHQC